MARRSYAGGAVTTFLTAPIIQTDIFMLIDSSQGWPTGLNGPMAAVIDRGEPAEEKVLLAEVNAGSALVSIRGYDGTTAQAHSAFATFELCITAIDADEANAHVNSVAGVHGLAPSDRVVGEVRAATLTNKSMSGSDNAFSDIPRSASPQIDAALTGLQVELDQEQIDRAAADSTLQTNINNEAATRGAADTTLQTNIDTEVTNRTNADSAHVAAPDPHAQYMTAAEVDAAIAAVAPVDSGWITSTAGFTVAANWDGLTVRYRTIQFYASTRVVLNVSVDRQAPAISVPATGNVANTPMLTAVPLAIRPTAETAGFGPANGTGRGVFGTLATGGVVNLNAVTGTSDFANNETAALRFDYWL